MRAQKEMTNPSDRFSIAVMICQNSLNTLECSVESKLQEKQRLVEEMAGKVVAHRHGKHAKTDQQLEEWLWSRANIVASGCWEWIGPLSRDGYGAMVVHYQGKKIYRPHRLCWMICFGAIPEELRVCHTCDNPKCINPRHLWLGTMKENTWDSVLKGRANRARGESSGVAKLSAAQVIEMRKLRRDGNTFEFIGKAFGVTKTNARFVCAGRTWRHLL